MLVKAMNTETKGIFLRYVPTEEELLEMFKHWKKDSVIKPSELVGTIKLNLEKYNKMDLYPKVREELKITSRED